MKNVREIQKPKRKLLLKFNLIIVLIVNVSMFLSCSDEGIDEIELQQELVEEDILSRHTKAPWYDQVAEMKKAMTKFRNFDYAKENGYFVQAGHYVPNMGYHFLNPALVDPTFDYLKPEIILFYPDDGDMKFGGVEYLIPVADFDNPGDAPEGFIGDDDHWHLNPNAGGWTLHVWIGKKNPDGIFAAFNPKVPATPPN